MHKLSFILKVAGTVALLAFVAAVVAPLLAMGPEHVGTLLIAAGGFGAPFRALPKAAVEAAATPSSGHAQESIWHQLYDTQTYVSAATTRLVFFNAANADRTLTNMEQAGALPRPQSLQLHNICCDLLSLTPVSTAAGGIAGVLNDMALLLLASASRPTFTLSISQKSYGPYSLTLLHGTGGPAGFGWGTFTAEESIQYSRNDPGPGWNYFGRVIIPEQVNFNLEMNWAAAQTLTGDTRVRCSLFGVLNRRVL